MLGKYFQLEEHQSSVRRELTGGLVTFLTMSYIIFVNPSILSSFNGQPTGMDYNGVFIATCISSAVATLIMGLYANYPIALAPGMGHNVFFVGVVFSLGALGFPSPWRVALGAVFIAGMLFLLLSTLGLREAIINAISPSMKNSIAVGIGLFIAFIGLRHGGLLAANPGTWVSLNPKLLNADVAVFCLGFIVTGVLVARRIPGAILWGIVASSGLAAALGKITWPENMFGWPHMKESTIFQMDLVHAVLPKCLPFIVVFLFMDMFDTIGTLIGVAEQAGLMKDGRLPRARQALAADAVGTVVGACLGTSTVTSYIESAAGVEQGGRTGLTAVTTALLFLLALPFSGLVQVIGQYPPITAAALLFVGMMMLRNVTRIDWSDPTEAVPASTIILGIPFCYSIADGMALGLILYPVLKFLSGRTKEVKWLSYALCLALLAYFVFVRSH